MRSISDQINEGMWRGDLNDLFRPVISIDEYASKVDDNAVVVGFYVQDMDAADDLNRFLQKSPTDLLDIDVSPAPDQHGYYIVFVEMLRNDQTVANITSIIEEVSPLTNVGEWKLSVLGTKGILPATEENLTKTLGVANKSAQVRSLKQTKERAKTVQKLMSKLKADIAAAILMLKNSQITDVQTDGEGLVLNDGRYQHAFEVLGVGDKTALTEAGLDNKPISDDMTSQRLCRELSIGLGIGWGVIPIGECTVIHNTDSDEVIVLKEI